jgi:hypothetical protein
MTREKLLRISLSMVSLLVIGLSVFDKEPGILSKLFVMFWLIAPDFIMWFGQTRLFWALAMRLFNLHLPGKKGQITKFLEWMDEQKIGPNDELDLEDAPWIPKFIAEYLIRLGVLLHTQRILIEKEQRKKKTSKKATKRGKRGGTSSYDGTTVH